MSSSSASLVSAAAVGAPAAGPKPPSIGTLVGREVQQLQKSAFDINAAIAALNNDGLSSISKMAWLIRVHSYLHEIKADEKQQIQSVLKEVLERQGLMLQKAESDDDKKKLGVFFQEVELLHDRIAVGAVESGAGSVGVQGIFDRAVHAPTTFQSIFAKKACSADTLKGYKAYFESLPLVQQLLDATDVAAADGLRGRFTPAQKTTIEDAIAFAWQNKPLNDFLHGKTCRTRAEDFFHNMSHLSPPLSTEEIKRFTDRLSESGVDDVVQLTKEIENLEKDILLSTAQCFEQYKKALQLKEYLPSGYQRISEERIQKLRDALGAAKKARATALAPKLQDLLEKSLFLQTKIKVIQAAPSPADGTLSPTFLYRLDEYNLFPGPDLKKVVGQEHVLFRKLKDEEKAEAHPSPILQLRRAFDTSIDLGTQMENLATIFPDSLPGDISLSHTVYEDIVKGEKKPVERGWRTFFSNIPRMIKALRKGSFDQFATYLFGPIRHADIFVANNSQMSCIGIFAGEKGVDESSVGSRLTFSGKRFRPDFYACLTPDARTALIKAWAPVGSSATDKETIVRAKLFEMQAESMHKILVTNKDVYADIKITAAHVRNSFLRALIPTWMKWLARKISFVTGQIIRRQKAQFESPLLAKPGEKERSMFCSEFVSAVLQTAQHDLEEQLHGILSDFPKDRAIMTPIIPYEMRLSSLLPSFFKRHLKEMRVEDSEGRKQPVVLKQVQSSVDRVLFGDRKYYRQIPRKDRT